MNMNVITPSNLSVVIKREKRNNGSNFTIKSAKTGTEYTYKIRRSLYKDKWYTHVSVEARYLNFKYLGSYFNGKLYHKGKVVTTPSAIAISWVLKKVEENKNELLEKSVEVMHTGHCLVCGRELTDSHSIETGIGPVCMRIN